MLTEWQKQNYKIKYWVKYIWMLLKQVAVPIFTSLVVPMFLSAAHCDCKKKKTDCISICAANGTEMTHYI